MMRPGLPPTWQILLVDLLFPPALALAWRIMAAGWAGAMQGGSVSERSKQLLGQGFWALLLFFYLMTWGFTIWALMK